MELKNNKYKPKKTVVFISVVILVFILVILWRYFIGYKNNKKDINTQITIRAEVDNTHRVVTNDLKDIETANKGTQHDCDSNVYGYDDEKNLKIICQAWKKDAANIKIILTQVDYYGSRSNVPHEFKGVGYLSAAKNFGSGKDLVFSFRLWPEPSSIHGGNISLVDAKELDILHNIERVDLAGLPSAVKLFGTDINNRPSSEDLKLYTPRYSGSYYFHEEVIPSTHD